MCVLNGHGAQAPGTALASLPVRSVRDRGAGGLAERLSEADHAPHARRRVTGLAASLEEALNCPSQRRRPNPSGASRGGHAPKAEITMCLGVSRITLYYRSPKGDADTLTGRAKRRSSVKLSDACTGPLRDMRARKRETQPQLGYELLPRLLRDSAADRDTEDRELADAGLLRRGGSSGESSPKRAEPDHTSQCVPPITGSSPLATPPPELY